MKHERVKLLAEQAGFNFYNVYNIVGEDLGESIEANSWTAAEQFADLIINECLAECWYDKTPLEISNSIRTKFGMLTVG